MSGTMTCDPSAFRREDLVDYTLKCEPLCFVAHLYAHHLGAAVVFFHCRTNCYSVIQRIIHSVAGSDSNGSGPYSLRNKQRVSYTSYTDSKGVVKQLFSYYLHETDHFFLYIRILWLYESNYESKKTNNYFVFFFLKNMHIFLY